MAIRYNKPYNDEIYKSVRNFNRKVKRAGDAGVPKNRLPNQLKVSELKGSFKSRTDLNKVLKQLDKFSRTAVKNLQNFNGDVRSTKWNYDFLKINQKLAKEYYEKEFRRVENRTAKYPGERNYLNTIQAKIDILSKDVSKLDEKEFTASLTAVNSFINAPSLQRERYKEYLSCVGDVMDVLNIPKKEQDAFFKKFETLTPTQFLYAYDNNDIIGRIYELYFKRDEEGNVILNIDMDNPEPAVDIIKDLFSQVDYIVADAKANSV